MSPLKISVFSVEELKTWGQKRWENVKKNITLLLESKSKIFKVVAVHLMAPFRDALS